MKTTHSS